VVPDQLNQLNSYHLDHLPDLAELQSDSGQEVADARQANPDYPVPGLEQLAPRHHSGFVGHCPAQSDHYPSSDPDLGPVGAVPTQRSAHGEHCHGQPDCGEADQPGDELGQYLAVEGPEAEGEGYRWEEHLQSPDGNHPDVPSSE
jgi:hypothetical protein